MADLYHVLNRGVDKKKIFIDDQDHFRFVHDLYEFNDVESADYIRNSRKLFIKANFPSFDDGKLEERQSLVHVHAFCLMPNHYHLLLSPVVEGGIPKFMKKLNMGYSRYFNERYERKGTLFEGRYKSLFICHTIFT